MMNKTHQILTFLFGLLLFSGGLTGCIKEDMSDCPPPVVPPEPDPDPDPDPDPTTGTLKLALTYTMHNTQENGVYADLFNSQVHKVDVFVFDEAGRLVKQITDEAAPAFADNYTKEIELPGGDYRFVVWGNQYDDETVHDCQGEDACLEDSHMSLLALTRSHDIPMLTDSLFHGATAQPVTVVNGEEQTVPVDLMKNRNDIRLVVRWKEKEKTDYCTRPEHAEAITAENADNNRIN